MTKLSVSSVSVTRAMSPSSPDASTSVELSYSRRMRLKTYAAIVTQKNERQVSFADQCEHTSSKEYRMPPRGALNAAAIPAAAPMPTHTRCLLGMPSRRRGMGPRRSRESPAATHAPTWTIGPSRPRGSPVATTKVVPITFDTSVRGCSSPGTRVPLRYAFRGGRPESAARGAKCVSTVAPNIRKRFIPRKVAKAAPTCGCSFS
eukprot:scaffold161988_cov34-Tisochrysis_lutea.AAC.6